MRTLMTEQDILSEVRLVWFLWVCLAAGAGFASVLAVLGIVMLLVSSHYHGSSIIISSGMSIFSCYLWSEVLRYPPSETKLGRLYALSKQTKKQASNTGAE